MYLASTGYKNLRWDKNLSNHNTHYRQTVTNSNILDVNCRHKPGITRHTQINVSETQLITNHQTLFPIGLVPSKFPTIISHEFHNLVTQVISAAQLKALILWLDNLCISNSPLY